MRVKINNFGKRANFDIDVMVNRNHKDYQDYLLFVHKYIKISAAKRYNLFATQFKLNTDYNEDVTNELYLAYIETGYKYFYNDKIKKDSTQPINFLKKDIYRFVYNYVIRMLKVKSGKKADIVKAFALETSSIGSIYKEIGDNIEIVDTLQDNSFNPYNATQFNIDVKDTLPDFDLLEQYKSKKRVKDGLNPIRIKLLAKFADGSRYLYFKNRKEIKKGMGIYIDPKKKFVNTPTKNELSWEVWYYKKERNLTTKTLIESIQYL